MCQLSEHCQVVFSHFFACCLVTRFYFNLPLTLCLLPACVRWLFCMLVYQLSHHYRALNHICLQLHVFPAELLKLTSSGFFSFGFYIRQYLRVQNMNIIEKNSFKIKLLNNSDQDMWCTVKK